MYYRLEDLARLSGQDLIALIKRSSARLTTLDLSYNRLLPKLV